ncbi:hypothetical protein ACP4TB_29830 [Streptomyces sp. DR3-1]|uniref:hypothetical protein n=1 Tax=Streptomyces sp. DR3-1 TaxID=2951169 RepID=UPI002043FDCB|nr:hypothetical protein [Streptomyces sp. DR3-1]MCM3822472.1 hypothetical protein [Streptomyces sp. DR3-1]
MAIPGNLLAAATSTMDPSYVGWRVRSNATLVSGTGGRVGPRCLGVKSTAASPAEAETVSFYPVTAGQVYYAFADAGGSVVERIGIEWLDSKAIPVGAVTWSLWTMSAMAGWHRVSVAGVAPVGATRARLVLASAQTTAGVSHFWENVYFGGVIRTLGNLMPWSVEATEIDASGWTAEVNATVSRQVPAMSWPVDAYTAGGHTLAMTATAAGNAAVRTTVRPAVTPGTEYLAYAYLQPPVLTATAWIELRWHDAAGNQIGAQRSTLAAPGTGMYRQRASAVAPAGAASCSVAAGLDGAGAGQVLRLETVVVTAAPALAPDSVIRQDAATFEQGTGGWTVSSGTATLARSTPWGAAALEGSYALTATSPSATASTLRSPRVPVTEGVNWRLTTGARATTGTTTSLWLRVRWYDSTGTSIGLSTGTGYAFANTGWYWMSTDAVAPAGAVEAAVELTVTASASASVLHVDGVSLRQVLPLTEVSVTEERGFATVTLRELILGYTLTVERETPDSKRAPVRGASGLIVDQPITRELVVAEDHEIPMGVPVRYRITMTSPSGARSTRSTPLVTVSLPDRNEVWLKDPGNPQRACRVMVQRAPDWQRPIEQAVHRVRGRRNPVVLSGRRGGMEGDLDIWTRTDEEREALHLLLDSGNVLLWQAMPGMGVADMYVQVAEVTEARTGGTAAEPWRSWSLPLTEVDQPVALGVNGSGGRTWQDVIAEFATCADVLAAYSTSEDLLLDRRRG